MSQDNVLPFRKRPPSKAEFEVYRQITRAWSPEVRRMMFPEHFKHEHSQGRLSP